MPLSFLKLFSDYYYNTVERIFQGEIEWDIIRTYIDFRGKI